MAATWAPTSPLPWTQVGHCYTRFGVRNHRHLLGSVDTQGWGSVVTQGRVTQGWGSVATQGWGSIVIQGWGSVITQGWGSVATQGWVTQGWRSVATQGWGIRNTVTGWDLLIRSAGLRFVRMQTITIMVITRSSTGTLYMYIIIIAMIMT